MSSKEVGKLYGVKPDTIRKRAEREKWPTPKAVTAKMQELQATQPGNQESVPQSKPDNGKALVPVQSQPLEVVEADMSQPIQLLQAMAESWLQKGEEHRALAFRIAHDALKKLSKKRVPLSADWQEVDKADKMARRAAGLDDGEKTKVNVELNLVNQRIVAMQQTVHKSSLA